MDDFMVASERFFNCQMRPPWSVELVGEINESGATFNIIEQDIWEGRSIYFSTTDVPGWEVGDHISIASVLSDGYEPFEISFLEQRFSGESIEIDEEIVVLRKGSYELILPGQYSKEWKILIEQCL